MFKVGDKVVCINKDNLYLSINRNANNLKLNRIYIVEEHSSNYLKLENIDFNYSSYRFVLLSEYRKQKINKILNK